MFEFLKTLLAAFSGLFSFLKQEKLIKAGEDSVKAAQATEEAELVIRTEEVRSEAKAAAASVPSSNSLPDDGFRRD